MRDRGDEIQCEKDRFENSGTMPKLSFNIEGSFVANNNRQRLSEPAFVNNSGNLNRGDL